MILYHGSIKKFNHFHKETIVQHLNYDIDSIGFWFTSNIDAAKPSAIGMETVMQKSETEFWEDGEPKVVQVDQPVRGFIYKVYMDELKLKIYESYSEDSFELFMEERDQYCDYFGTKKGNLTWKDQVILLNKEEANAKFRQNLMDQGFEGLVIRSTTLHDHLTDLYCIFSESSLLIADVIPIDLLEEEKENRI